MKTRSLLILSCLSAAALFLSSCATVAEHRPPLEVDEAPINALASTTVLTDIAQNVAGDTVKVNSLLPHGVDPHVYEAKPSDVAIIAVSNLLILNGVGYEFYIESLLENAGGERVVVEAADGLEVHQMPEHAYEAEGHEHEGEEHAYEAGGHENEAAEHEQEGEEGHDHIGHDHSAGDPHMWLDPIRVFTYVENIRDGFIQIDPEGAEVYTANAEAYSAELKELDRYITDQVKTIPAGRRLLVTNHEALGYFAERYGFVVVDTILPSFSSDATVSAQQVAKTIESIKSSGAPAILLGEVENTKMAEQIAAETGVKIVDGLYLETLTVGPPAATYIDMMKFNVDRIVEALK